MLNAGTQRTYTVKYENKALNGGIVSILSASASSKTWKSKRKRSAYKAKETEYGTKKSGLQGSRNKQESY